MAGGGREATAHVSGHAAGNRVHLDRKDPRIVRPNCDVILLRKAGNVFVIDLWIRKEATSRKPGFHQQA